MLLTCSSLTAKLYFSNLRKMRSILLTTDLYAAESTRFPFSSKILPNFPTSHMGTFIYSVSLLGVMFVKNPPILALLSSRVIGGSPSFALSLSISERMPPSPVTICGRTPNNLGSCILIYSINLPRSILGAKSIRFLYSCGAVFSCSSFI